MSWSTLYLAPGRRARSISITVSRCGFMLMEVSRRRSPTLLEEPWRDARAPMLVASSRGRSVLIVMTWWRLRDIERAAGRSGVLVMVRWWRKVLISPERGIAKVTLTPITSSPTRTACTPLVPSLLSGEASIAEQGTSNVCVSVRSIDGSKVISAVHCVVPLEKEE